MAPSQITNPTVAELESQYNPAQPQIFDQVLPLLLSLEPFTVSATEISPNAFSLLPPALRHLEIQLLNHCPAFRFTPVVLFNIQNHANALAVKSVRLQDLAWREVEVEALSIALVARGIAFDYSED